MATVFANPAPENAFTTKNQTTIAIAYQTTQSQDNEHRNRPTKNSQTISGYMHLYKQNSQKLLFLTKKCNFNRTEQLDFRFAKSACVFGFFFTFGQQKIFMKRRTHLPGASWQFSHGIWQSERFFFCCWCQFQQVSSQSVFAGATDPARTPKS